MNNSLEEVKQQAALDAAHLKKLILVILALALTIGTWFGIVPFSPADLVQVAMSSVWGVEQIADDRATALKSFESLAQFGWQFARGAIWTLCLAPLIECMYSREVGIILAGSVEAYKEQIREEKRKQDKLYRQEAEGHDLGKLISISSQKGGFISSPSTLIETTVGFYRVSGYVDKALKGAQVKRVYNSLVIGSEGGSTTYRLSGGY